MNTSLVAWAMLLVWPLLASPPPGGVTGTVAKPGGPGAALRPGGPPLHVEPTIAPTDTPWVAPDPPRPTARYGSYRAACDGLKAIAGRALGGWAKSARWSRSRERFEYHDAVSLVRTLRGTYYWDGDGPRPAEVPCLHMHYQSATEDAPGTMTLQEALQAAGWDMDNRYSADGPDGTYFAMACDQALVEIRGSWDGVDDSDSTYVPTPGETVELRCVPRPPEPRPRGSRAP